MQALTAQELEERLNTAARPRPVLLDVRESWEFEICRIDGAHHIPMGQIPGAIDKLDSDEEVVVICHHGMRSAQVARYLECAGFSKVYNLTGGIDAWAREIDRQMAQY